MPEHNLSSLTEKARELCRANCGELLFLTVFGSELYGTAIPGKSDTDLRGIFLPTPQSLALGESKHSIHFSTGSNDGRNSFGDIDIDLWSVQHWLQKLLPAADTGAMDILFAPSNEDCVLWRDARLDAVFNEPLRYFDSTKSKACSEYSLGQAKKYGIKGSRLGALRRIAAAVKKRCPEGAAKERLAAHAAELAAAAEAPSLCRIETVHGEEMLLLNGKWHGLQISMEEFFRRLDTELARYGTRAEDALGSGGIDRKALSHAVRAARQWKQMLTEGKVTFPLDCREEILTIKQGGLSWEETENLILSELAELEALAKTSPYAKPADADAARNVILNCYGLKYN